MCLPPLMYLTCPAMHTTKLPSGRPSTSCLRLRSYSAAGIPGVTSPGLTACAYKKTPVSSEENGQRGCACRWLTEVGVGLCGGLTEYGWLGWSMMRVQLGLSSICAAEGTMQTRRRRAHRTMSQERESGRADTQRHQSRVRRPCAPVCKLLKISRQRKNKRSREYIVHIE